MRRWRKAKRKSNDTVNLTHGTADFFYSSAGFEFSTRLIIMGFRFVMKCLQSFLFITSIACALQLANASEVLHGKDLEAKLTELSELTHRKTPESEASILAVFFTSAEPELVIAAGRECILAVKPGDLPRIVLRLANYPSPLPAMNIGPMLAERFEAAEIRKLVSRVVANDWWVQRNQCILLECVPHRDIVPALFQIYSASEGRVVKLESIEALSRIKDPQAVKALQLIHSASKDESERAAALAALGSCGSAADVPWIMQRLAANSVESICGAWAVKELSKTFPRPSAMSLLQSKEFYPRHAALVLFQELGAPEDWTALLRLGSAYPDVLQAIGTYFSIHPNAESATILLATPHNCNQLDSRASEAWCKAVGACAALADAAAQTRAFAVLSAKTAAVLDRQAARKEKELGNREAAIAAIYGLAALGTVQANELLMRLAFDSIDDTVAEYAAADLLKLKDPAPGNKFQFTLAAKLNGTRPELLRAVDLLSLMPGRAAVDLLIETLGRVTDDDTKIAVRDALARLTGHDFGSKAEVWTAWWKATNMEFFDKKLERVLKDRVAASKQKSPLSSASPGDPDYKDPSVLDLLALRKMTAWSLMRFAGDKETEAAVNSGLRWLAEHQDPDGKWNGLAYGDLNIARPSRGTPIELAMTNDVGLTGLALLTFLAGNHTHYSEDSIYRVIVSRSLHWYEVHQMNDGTFVEPVGRFNYHQAISTLALCEAYGMTGDELLKTAAQRGLDKIYSSQTPGEGWRYLPRTDTDISVVGWMIMAVKSGLMAGLDVDSRCRVSIARYFDKACSRVKFAETPFDDIKAYDEDVGAAYKLDEAWCGYVYNKVASKLAPGKLPMGALTGGAIAALNRIFLGYTRSHPFSIGAANLLKSRIPVARTEVFPSYYYYYGTLFMFQMGGDYWANWNKAMKRLLLSAQIKAPNPAAGTFPLQGEDDRAAGVIYSTTMSVLTLETYYRYLPMLWFSEENAK